MHASFPPTKQIPWSLTNFAKPESVQSTGDTAGITKIFFDIIAAIKFALSIPFNYIGSKFISFPEIVIRTAIFVKNWLFNTVQKPYLDFISKSGYSLSLTPLETQHYQKVLKIARMDAAIHTDNPDLLPENCNIVHDDARDGFKITLITEGALEKPDHVYVIFGAKGAEGTKNYDTSNIMEVLKNLAGFGTKNYERAKSKFEELEREYPCFFADPSKVTLGGLCIGATHAQFVALDKQKYKAVCLNSVALGATIQKRVGRDKLSKAPDLITHVTVKGDITSDPPTFIKVIDFVLSFFGVRTAGNFGNRYSIEPAKEFSRNTWNPVVIYDRIHCLFLTSIMKRISINRADLKQFTIRDNGTVAGCSDILRDWDVEFAKKPSALSRISSNCTSGYVNPFSVTVRSAG